LGLDNFFGVHAFSLNKNAFILHEDEDELRGTTSFRLLTKALSVIDNHRPAL